MRSSGIINLGRALGILVFAAALAGCAAMPQELKSSVGSIPGVSLLVDLSDLQSLMERMANDEVKMDEARELAARPIPPPPGASFEVAAMRSLIGASFIKDLPLVRERYALLFKHATNLDLLFSAASMVGGVELMSGNTQRAHAVYAAAELRLKAAPRKAGEPVLQRDSHLSLIADFASAAKEAGDFDGAERLFRDYVQSAGVLDKLPPRAAALFRCNMLSKRSELLQAKGENVRAFELAQQTAETTCRAKEIVAGRRSGDAGKVDRRFDEGRLGRALYVAAWTSLSVGQLASAHKYVEELRGVVSQGGNRKLDLNNLHAAEQALAGATGRYRDGVAAADAALRTCPTWLCNYELIRSRLESLKALMLLADGRPVEALSVIQGDPTGAALGPGQTRAIRIMVAGAAAALAGRTDAPRSAFDGLEQYYRHGGATEDAKTYAGVRALVYERRAKSTRLDADWFEAASAAKRFTQLWRRGQASGGVRTLLYPESILRTVKESSVVAIGHVVGRSGFTMDDLLDALSVLQESDTADDIAAAASRQRQLPGISAGQLRDLQDLQQAARAAQGYLMQLAQASDVAPDKLADAVKRADDAFSRLTTFLAGLRSSAPNLANALAATVPSVADLQARLSAGEALLAFHPSADATIGVLITKTGSDHRMLPLSLRDAASLVDRIRKSTTFDREVNVPAFDTDAARRLYDGLFGWCEGQLRGIKSLTISASGPLSRIPFGLLVARDSPRSRDYRQAAWLVKTFAVTHVPSISSWQAVVANPARAPSGGLLAWADPDFSGERQSPAAGGATRGLRRGVRSQQPSGATTAVGAVPELTISLPRLPETRDEVLAIARTLRASPQSDIVLGADATRSSVMRASDSGALGRKAVVVFATHGLEPGQVQGVQQPALALAREAGSPQASLLQLDDVIGLRMNAEWVLLSACNTSAAERAGGDALSGLARGFFFAGARSLLVTHWEVESESAAAITTRTMGRYVANPRTTRAEALQQASIELIEGRQQALQEWSHPAFWAPYALVGDGRRGGPPR